METECIVERTDRFKRKMITSDVDQETWRLAKIGAAMKSIRIGQWLAQAIKEKYQNQALDEGRPTP